ncbi:MAG: GntR family transcriptional regulator [Cellvibrionaceae bacterium]|nr:GntR family transcriptional regulator [Cellvibrionaceae bacterium]
MSKELDALLKVSDERKTLKQIVLDKLRRAILNLHFKPGQRLIERELCEMMGVSRTAVREALSFLSAEGLVTVVPNKGPIVTEITLEQAKGIYEIRAALEGLACQRFVVNANDDHVQQLIDAERKLGEGFHCDDIHKILESASDFYDVIFEGCANPMIRSTLKPLLARVNYLRATSMSSKDRHQESIAEIKKILEAIVKRDQQAAFDACVDHVFKARAAALDTLEKRQQGAECADSQPKIQSIDSVKT